MKKTGLFIISRYCCMENNCGKEYSTRLNLKRHILTSHFKTKRFECEICSRIFVSKQNLKEHKYLHSGEKPYECLQCSIRFRHISSYSLHQKYHKVGLAPTRSLKVDHLDKETQTLDETN